MELHSTKTIRAAVFAVMLALPVLAAESPHLRPGQYEITAEMKMEGIDQPMPPMTLHRCFTKEDVADPKKMVEPNMRKKASCEMTNMKVNGNHVSWAMQCKDDNARGTGEMTYGADGYVGQIHMEMQNARGHMVMNEQIKAHRTGDCK